MKQSKQEIMLNYKAKDLYEIVLKIEDYPQFIPWCSKIYIITKKKNTINANMIVNYKFFPTQEFTSKVTYDSTKKIINTVYIKGPLKDLHTSWQFIQTNKNKSKVIFTISFEFQNYVHQKLAELFYPLIENKMIKSFLKRADEILN